MKKGSIVSWQINTHCPAKNLNTDIRVTRYGAKQGGGLVENNDLRRNSGRNGFLHVWACTSVK